MQKNEERFGEYLASVRKSHHVTMRALASHLGFSPAYLSDVEHGHRSPFAFDILRKISRFLSLTQEEECKMFDEAALSRDDVPPDVAEYIKGRAEVIKALRTAQALGIQDEAWTRFVEQMQHHAQPADQKER